MRSKVIDGLVVILLALFLTYFVIIVSSKVVEAEKKKQQPIEQKLDEIRQIVIEIRDRECATLRMPVFTDKNDREAQEYTRENYQEEVE